MQDFLNNNDNELNEFFSPQQELQESQPKLIKQNSTTFNGFSLLIQDLITWVPKKHNHAKKIILKGITTHFKKGTMTAIVGPSGCGKTTLVNFLSGRQDESQIFHNFGHYFINNTEIEDITQFKQIIGYVPQDDIMEERMTPREIFQFYLDFRWNKGDDFIKREKLRKIRVQEMIDLLGLQNCSDTVIGNHQIRGISGGEKKRVNIGIELISNPSLLFLDEPTTGLDSFNALHVIECLEKMKELGITIITIMHQPSTKILKKFDQILLLVEGNLIFDGSLQQIPISLKELGFQVPVGQPPLEHFLEILDKSSIRLNLEKNNTITNDVDKQIDEIYQE